MPSPAQSYFNTLPPVQKQQVQASLEESGSSMDQWFQNAVNAGVPGAVSAAGGTQVADQDKGYTGVGMPAAGNTADWLGKRNPTPAELKQYASEQGWSEDFARFSDAQTAAWIKESWDINANAFRSEGDTGSDHKWRGEKPTDGPLSGAAQAMGAKGGGKGKGVGRDLSTPDPGVAVDPLQKYLETMAQHSSGYFGEQGERTGADMGNVEAQALRGGGVWSTDPGNNIDPATGAPAAGAPARRIPSRGGTAPAPGRAPAPANALAGTLAGTSLFGGAGAPAPGASPTDNSAPPGEIAQAYTPLQAAPVPVPGAPTPAPTTSATQALATGLGGAGAGRWWKKPIAR